MTNEQIAEAFRSAQQQWEYLKRHWFDLKLPGSAYSPSEFFAALMISQVHGQPEELAARIREGQTRLHDLQDQGVLSRFGGDSEKMAICALAALSAQDQKESAAPPVEAALPEPTPLVSLPTPEPEVVCETVVGSCPHCSHDPDRCANGEYKVSPPQTTSPDVESVPTSVEVNPNEQSVGCEHVGVDGKCCNCTEDETEECSGGCCSTMIVAKAFKCKGYDECGHLYCEECNDRLSDYGYCGDCAICACDGCDNDIDHGTEKRCANTECEAGYYFCEECAPRLRNPGGLCAECAKEDTWDCNDCGATCLASRITKCRGETCEYGYCEECNDNQLDEEGFCLDCTP